MHITQYGNSLHIFFFSCLGRRMYTFSFSWANLHNLFLVYSTDADFRQSSTDTSAFVALLADLSSSQIFQCQHRSSCISTASNCLNPTQARLSVSRSPEFVLHYRTAVTMVTVCLFNLITWHRKPPKASMSIDVAQPSPKPRQKPISSPISSFFFFCQKIYL